MMFIPVLITLVFLAFTIIKYKPSQRLKIYDYFRINHSSTAQENSNFNKTVIIKTNISDKYFEVERHIFLKNNESNLMKPQISIETKANNVHIAQYELDLLKKNTVLFRETSVDCDAFINKEKQTIKKILRNRNFKRNFKEAKNEEKQNKFNSLVHLLIKFIVKRDCQNITDRIGFINSHLTDEEKGFPIAFSILFHNYIESFINLISAIYRPQNYYCVHIDKKAHKIYHRLIKQLSRVCFPNIIIPDTRISVFWGEWSVVEAEIVCMKELIKQKNWKYLINLTGQEFPLKTNHELVKILQAYKGANDVDGSFEAAKNRPQRWFF